MDHRQRCEATFLRFGTAHQHQSRRAIGDRTGVSRCHRTALTERRLQRRYFRQIGLGGLFVIADQALLFTHRDLHRHDLGAEAAILDRLLRTGQRRHRKIILSLAAKTMGLCAIFSKGAHQAASIVSVLETIEEHVIEHPTVAHAISAACPVQQIRRVGHALHTTRNDHLGTPGQQLIMGQNGCLHARAAHFVQRGAARILVQPGAQSGLTRRCLAQPGRQHATKQHLIHIARRNTRALNRRTDDCGTKLRRGQSFEVALKPAHGRSYCADNDNRIIG